MQFQFRKLFAAGTAAVMLLSGMTFFQTTASAEGTMTADDITENMTIGWNIGNSLDSTGYSGETSWGNPRQRDSTPFVFPPHGIRMSQRLPTKTVSLFTQSASSGCSVSRK